MNARSPARRSSGIWPLAVAASLAAGCTAEATQPDEVDEPDASRIGLPDDAAPDPDATSETDPDAGPPPDAYVEDWDANLRCVLPLEIDLDGDGYASFFYDHPDCSGESGDVVGAVLAFEDSIDFDESFSAYEYADVWQIQEIPYPDNDCSVDTEINALECTDADAGDLIPVQLLDGTTQLDVEFRLDHDGQTVTVESATYTQ